MIVEGELDKLALNEAGLWNVVSVPDGAPARAGDGPLPAPARDAKYGYVHACEPLLAAAKRIVLATDNDAPGLALAHELARRLGRDRCHVVQWPSGAGSSLAARRAAAAGADGTAQPDPQQQQQNAAPGGDGGGDGGGDDDSSQQPRDQWFRKDANEVLLRDGAADLRAYVAAAQPLPVTGLLRFGHFWQEVYDLYISQGVGGRAAAASTGWAGVDEFYRVRGRLKDVVRGAGVSLGFVCRVCSGL